LQISNWNWAAPQPTYQPNTYLTYAQAAVTAIRAVDSAAPIYIQGYQTGYTGATWSYYNWDMLSLTGGGLIFENHNYFDGPQAFGDGGTYGGTFTSYSIDTQSGVQQVGNFVQWLQTVGARGQVGEFQVPEFQRRQQCTMARPPAKFPQISVPK
jgi:hypothetical protein